MPASCADWFSSLNRRTAALPCGSGTSVRTAWNSPTGLPWYWRTLQSVRRSSRPAIRWTMTALSRRRSRSQAAVTPCTASRSAEGGQSAADGRPAGFGARLGGSMRAFLKRCAKASAQRRLRGGHCEDCAEPDGGRGLVRLTGVPRMTRRPATRHAPPSRAVTGDCAAPPVRDGPTLHRPPLGEEHATNESLLFGALRLPHCLV